MMSMKIVNILVFLVALAGAIYYSAVNRETQGAVVVLLGILYFVALPQISRR
jgi:hypothetical protein